MRKLISFDWAVKKILRSKANFGILEGFLSELLKEDIIIKQLLESESNKDIALSKQNRVDLLVENTKGELIIIEVQNQRQIDFMQRMLYSTSKLVVGHILEGQSYQEIKKIISVNIVYFDLGQGEDYLYKGRTEFVGLNKKDYLQLSNNQKLLFKKEDLPSIFPEYYIIKVNNFDDVAKNTLDEWVFFLKNEEIKDDFHAKGLTEAKKKLDILKLNKEEREIYDAYQFELHYQASMYLSTYTLGNLEGSLKGREIGKEEGIKIGKEEGIEMGKEIGKEEGKYEKAKEIALKAKQSNLTIEAIIALTGLDKEEIDNL
ncbi:MAG TPA: Rpn family recombination-promoting nuclease/putative transposase [Candidatus Kapabacteria bacterium]|nr:Rpn family recombination-promoting nuclease/putative transposase [Candidatus Kapabacteria bacterium]